MAARDSAPQLDLKRVFAASSAVVGRRWPALGMIVIAAWAPGAADALARPFHFRRGVHDPQTLSLYVAVSVGFLCINWLRQVTLVATALDSGRDGSLFRRVVATSSSGLLTLLPYLVCVELPAAADDLWELLTPATPVVGAGYEALISRALISSVAFSISGLILTACWGLVIPVAVAERRGLIPCLSRSWTLLSGNRWRFVGLAVIMAILGGAPTFLGSLLIVPLIEPLHGQVQTYLRAEGVVAGLIAGIVDAVWLVMTAASYSELRRLREGAPHDQVAEIFG